MGKRSRHAGSPEDVLRGRAHPDGTALCALVREVNPSGIEMPAAERARRYTTKNRLQSLFVTPFANEIEVLRDPNAAEGVVLLRRGRPKQQRRFTRRPSPERGALRRAPQLAPPRFVSESLTAGDPSSTWTVEEISNPARRLRIFDVAHGRTIGSAGRARRISSEPEEHSCRCGGTTPRSPEPGRRSGRDDTKLVEGVPAARKR